MSAILPSSTLCCPTAFCDAPIVVSVPGPAGPTGPEGPPADGNLVGWFVANTLADARLIPAAATNTFLVQLGGAVLGDGFGGQWYWDPLSNALDNATEFGGSVINPTGNFGPGRWLRYI
jgi:hypothetical protein